jgi:hypothetical protein
VALAKAAAALGCDALMVLPPYVYQGNWREMKTHVATVFEATPLSCMLYNNPVAYGTDFLPEQICELAAEYENFEAVKESSTDVRRVSAIRALLDRRLEISVGVDDAVLEAIGVGARPLPAQPTPNQSGHSRWRPNLTPSVCPSLPSTTTTSSRKIIFGAYSSIFGSSGKVYPGTAGLGCPSGEVRPARRNHFPLN